VSIAVTLIAGFLGAGKTTLINSLLQNEAGLAIAAIVNDFGSINIDAKLISENSEDVIGLKNGCVCCSLQGDLLRTLKSILSRDGRIDHILIEASGVSDPQGIIEVLMDPVVHEAVRLDAVVTVVDVEALADNPALEADPLWLAQVTAGDFIALSKGTEDQVAAMEARMRARGKTLVFPSISPPTVAMLGIGPVDRPVRPGQPVLASDRFVTLEWQWKGSVSAQAFQACIETLVPSLVRAKGIINLQGQDARSFNFNLVGRRATIEPMARRQDDCQLVLIGERGKLDLDNARTMLIKTFVDSSPVGQHG
jgi:G3E family GTPase